MNKRELGKYKSWLTSAGIALAIGLWLTTGQLSSDKPDTDATITEPSEQKTRSSVRTRTQTAESVTRTVVVNGNTAPARIVEINAETDGRVESTGIERGERLDGGVAAHAVLVVGGDSVDVLGLLGAAAAAAAFLLQDAVFLRRRAHRRRRRRSISTHFVSQP